MSITLLIADDEGIERRALKLQLERTFPEITLLRAAENGLELLELARANRPDIVLADIEMPGMNGLKALEQLRSEGIQPHVVIMTAYSSERYLKESLSLRVFAYLEKPIHRNQVEATLRALVGEIEKERRRNAEAPDPSQQQQSESQRRRGGAGPEEPDQKSAHASLPFRSIARSSSTSSRVRSSVCTSAATRSRALPRYSLRIRSMVSRTAKALV